MTNPYMKASKVSEEDFLRVLNCYCDLEGPLTAARVSGLSRQSVTAIYLKLSNRIRSIIPIQVWACFYEDVERLGLGELKPDGAFELNSYADLFHHLGDLSKEAIVSRRNTNKDRYVETTDTWEVLKKMNTLWKGIPNTHFDIHASIALYHAFIQSQIKVKYEYVKANNGEESFWEQQSKDYPQIQHNNDIKVFRLFENISLIIQSDLLRFLCENPLNKSDSQADDIFVDVYSNPERMLEILDEALKKNEI